MSHRSVLCTGICTLVAIATVVVLSSPTSRGVETTALKKFTLVYNVNNSGYIDVCGCKHKEVRQGSLTRRASFLKQFRTTGRDILLVDGGSTLFAIEDRVKDEHRKEAIRKAELIVEAYNRMGYQVMAVGPFDLAAGLDVFLDLAKRAKFTILSANMVSKKTGERYFPASTIIEVGGVRVGLIGLTLETMTKRYLVKVAPDLELLDPFDAAKKAYDEIRDKTDLVIALSHIREETNFELIKQLKGLEILIDPFIQYGNHHTWIKEHEWVGEKEETLLLRSDGQGARLGVVDIELVSPGDRLLSGNRLDELQEKVQFNEATDDEKAELVRLRGKNLWRFTRMSIEPHHLTDPEIDHLISEWKKNVDLSEVKALEGTLPRKDEFVTHARCQSCHEKQYAFWKGTTHAHAYETLKKTNDHHRYDCVGCHTLGYGVAFLDTSQIGAFADVQCESCHGTNKAHLETPEENRFGRVKRFTCLTCHNEAQTRTEFNFHRAKRQVACPKG